MSQLIKEKKKMKNSVKKWLLAILSLSIFGSFGVGILKINDVNAQNSTLLTGTTVEMYLVAGQSNAVGYSPKGENNQVFENVWYTGEVNKQLNGSNANVNMGDYTAYANVTAGQGRNINSIGPEYGMAKVLNQYYAGTNTKALIMKSAAGGTHMAYTGGESATHGNWYPKSLWGDTVNPAQNSATDPMGVQYYNFVENFKTVYTELKSEGYNPVVKGMVWMQGCSDVATTNYGELLQTFIDDIRSDIYEVTLAEADKTMPFVIGEICMGYKAGETAVQAFNEVQRSVATVKTNTYTVPTKGLYLGSDRSHYTTEGAVGLGERFGRKLLETANIIPTADILVTGASVYVGDAQTEDGVDKNGIRFQVLAKKSLVESGAEIGALLLPADMTTETELKVDTVVIQNEQVEGIEKVTNETLTVEKWEASRYEDYLQTNVYLYNFPASDYNREILASAYIKSGNSYTYSQTISRSMAYVALAAENDNDERASSYIKSYNVNYYDEDGITEINGFEDIIGRYGSLIEEPESIEGEVGKIVDEWYLDKDCTQTFDFTKTVKGTTNLYSKWIDGYKVGAGQTMFFQDEPTAVAGEGFVVRFTLGASREAGAYFNNGGLYVELGDGRYHKIVFNTNGVNLRLTINESSYGEKDNILHDSCSYDGNSAVDVTIAFYGGTYHIQFGSYKTSYDCMTGYKYINSANVFDTTQTRKIGLCGAIESVAARFTNVSYEIGDDEAKAAVIAMGLTPTESYVVKAGEKQLLANARTAEANEGFVTSFKLGASANTGGYFNNGGLYVELGDGRNHKITFNTNGEKLRISIYESSYGQKDNILHDSCAYDGTGVVDVTIVFYGGTYYIQFGSYTTSYHCMTGYTYINSANVFDTTQTRTIGLCGAIDTVLARFKNVTYTIGNDEAKNAVVAMGLNPTESYVVKAGEKQLFIGTPTATAGEGFVVNFKLGVSSNTGSYFNNGGLYVELGNGNYHKITFNTNDAKTYLRVSIFESTKNTQMNIVKEDCAYNGEEAVDVTIVFYNGTYYIKFGTYTISYDATMTYSYIDATKIFDTTQTRKIGLCGAINTVLARFTNVSYEIGSDEAKAAVIAMGIDVE